MNEEIELRKLNIKDAEKFRNLMNDKQILKEVGWTEKKGYSIVDARKEIKRKGNRSDYIFYGIFLDNDLVGKISLNHPDETKTIYEVGYIISRKHRNRGVATEALGKICKIGFEDKKIKRIWAKVIPNNSASEKVLRKNGFKKEGYLRKAFFLNGRYNDEIIYGRVR